MISIKNLSDHDLEAATLHQAKSEQSATLKLLEYLSELDARELYAKRGYSSLFVYVRDVLHYSESQASERINSMRLMRKVPEVKEALADKKLNLTNAAKIASFARQEKLSVKDTARVVAECAGKSTREVESLLLAQSSAPAGAKPETLKPVSVERSRLSVDLDQEMLQHIETIKKHSANPHLTIGDILKIALKNEAHRLEKRLTVKPPARETCVKNSTVPHKANESGSGEKKESANNGDSEPALTRDVSLLNAVAKPASPSKNHSSQKDLASDLPQCEPKKHRSRYIPKALKVAVRERAHHCCEYVDPESGKRCGAVKYLQLDHITPFAKGGTHTLDNLQILCARHNQLRVPQHLRPETRH